MITQLIVYYIIIISKTNHKILALYLRKQQTPDADLKATRKHNFTGNLGGQATMFFIIEESKETILDFAQGPVRMF